MSHYLEDMPAYVAGQLNAQKSAALEEHLPECATCRDELAFWLSLSVEIRARDARVTAPEGLAERALRHIHATETKPGATPRLFKVCQNAFNLLRSQAYLIKREIWPASAGVMGLGVIVGLLSNHAEVISYFAPLVASAGLALLYGPGNDPAHELVLSTPISAWKILLARLSVVSAYNLLLALLSSLAMLTIIPIELLGMVILGWFAPMAFLSALALLLSLWMNAGKAVVISYGLWILQYVQLSKVFSNQEFTLHWDSFLNVYKNLWQSPSLLLVLSLVFLSLALLSAHINERGLTRMAI